MGATNAALVNIRGWLEGARDDIALVRDFVEEEVVNEWDNFGWRFPHQQNTGHWYAFYGLHVEPDGINWFVNQLRQLAPLAASGSKPLIRGLFIVSDEQMTMTQLHVRDGQVHLEPGDSKYAYLDA
ncbi:hypothetical protein [Amycolatopsis sp. NPDC021455]|uniref:hypothetical protein n=1 Tax=Amycolatopsis sp. NPDC021455 TaxID=3154901 RepID=UPI0033FE2A0D